MKNTNKRRVLYFNILLLLLLLFLVMILIIHTIDIHIIPIKILRITPVVVILIFSTIIAMLINGQMIFEYDISGEVLSIKNYKWFLINKKIIFPVFEMPKKSLIKFEIENVLFKKYLNIFFRKESGNIMKKRIDITGCTNKQTKNIHLDLVYFLIDNKYEEKRTRGANK